MESGDRQTWVTGGYCPGRGGEATELESGGRGREAWWASGEFKRSSIHTCRAKSWVKVLETHLDTGNLEPPLPRVAGGGGPDIQPILSRSPQIPCQTHQGSLRKNEELAPPRPPGRKGATHWPQDGTMPSDFLALLTVEREREKAFATSPMGDHS